MKREPTEGEGKHAEQIISMGSPQQANHPNGRCAALEEAKDRIQLKNRMDLIHSVFTS